MSRRVVFFGLLVMNVLCTHGLAQENRMLYPRPVNPNVVIQDPATLKKVEFPDNPPENPAGYLRACFQSKYGEENLEQLMSVHDHLLGDFTKWESLSGEEKTKLENAYTTQWVLLLTGNRMIDDVKIRNKIFEKFKEALLYDGQHQNSMFYVMNSLISVPYRSQTSPTDSRSQLVGFAAYLGTYYQGKYGEKNLKQSMDVLDRLRDDFAKWETLSDKEKAKLENAYISLWAILLTGGAMTKDVKIQNRVFDKFRDTLLYDGRHQVSMLFTAHVHDGTHYWSYDILILRTAFARFYGYLKKDLWKLLERSENAAVINNLCVIALGSRFFPKELDAGDWNKFVSKKAALAQQRITPETAMAIIELSRAAEGHNAREAEKKFGPTPIQIGPNGEMPQATPVKFYYPMIMRLVDMEQKMQVEEGGKSIPYKNVIQRMVQNNSAEGW